MIDKKLLNKYNDIIILAGAGFSVDSGLPDYRELHKLMDIASKKFSINPADIESPDFYKKNPSVAWGIQARIMSMFLGSKPHAGYNKLYELTKDKNTFVITSNIDEHFRHIGFDENKLYEIHGRLTILQCTNRSCNIKHPLWKTDIIPKETDMILEGDIPKCKYCNSYARPNVCFTDDNSFCNKIRNAQKAKFNNWIKKVANRRNPKVLVFEIGCGRHKNAIGMNKLQNNTFCLMSKELVFPDTLNNTNIKVIRVNPDKNIPKEEWEDVYYQKAVDFFT